VTTQRVVIAAAFVDRRAREGARIFSMLCRGPRALAVRAIACGLALLLAHVPAPVFGQSKPKPSSAELELARSLYYDGLELIDQGQWQEAADRLERVLAIRDSAVVSYHLATAYSHLGRNVEARERLRRVQGDPAAAGELREAATKLLPEVEAKVGRMILRLTGDPEGTRILFDGRPAPAVAVDVPVPVDLGEVEVSVLRDEEEVAAARVRVDDASAPPAEVFLEIPPRPKPEPEPIEQAQPPPVLVPVAAPEPGPEPEPAPLAVQPGPRRDDDGLLGQWWFWTAVGAVAAAGVVGALILTDEPEPADASAVAGDFTPGVLEGRVQMP
jgi:hypothetical protein